MPQHIKDDVNGPFLEEESFARSNKSIRFLQDKSEDIEKGEGSFSKPITQFSVEMRNIDSKQGKYDMLISRPKAQRRNLAAAIDRAYSGTLDGKRPSNNLPSVIKRRASDQRQQLYMTSRQPIPSSFATSGSPVN